MRERGRWYETVLRGLQWCAAVACVCGVAHGQGLGQVQQLDLQLQELRNSLSAAHDSSAALGADTAGHTLATDIDALVLTSDTTAQLQDLRKQATQTSAGSGNAASAVTAVYEASALLDREQRRLKLLQDYWQIVPALRYLRELWQKQLALAPTVLASIGAPQVTALVAASNKKVAALEQNVWDLRGQVPDDAKQKAPLFAAEAALVEAYNAERQAIPTLVATNPSRDEAEVATTPRTTACPAPATADGARTPNEAAKTVSMGDPAAFYPATEEDRLAEGRVLVALKIAPNGCMTHSGIKSSTGDAALDAAALQLVETGVFLPALSDGKPVESYKSLAIRFVFKR